MKKLLMTASVYSHIRNFHLPYLREFQRLGWQTHVGCRGIPADAPYIDAAIELPFEKRMSAPSNFCAAKLLRERMREERYDLVITHTTLAAFFTRLAAKGLRERAQLVDVMHGYLFDDDTPRLKRSVLLTAERLTAPETDLLLTMNRWDFDLAQRYHLGAAVGMIPGMGVDFARLDRAAADGLDLRREQGVPTDAFVLLCAAEFSARKSQHVLIEAMKSLPEDVVLALCGTGALWEDCKRLAAERGVGDRVLFPGQIADMGAWYRMADASVTASRSEGLPFNVMEAMHMHLPVVASAVKGHVDLIEDGETGLLYPYGNADACARQLRRLVDDAALRGKIRTQAARSVARFALDRVLDEVMERYLSCIPGEQYKRGAAAGV